MEKRKLDENENIISDNVSPKRTRLNSRNKSDSLVIHRIKQTVFEFTSEQVYELLLQHGLSIFICESFLSRIY